MSGGQKGHLQGLLRADEAGEGAQVLRDPVAHNARHEAAPVQRHGDADGHLIQPNVALVGSARESASARLLHLLQGQKRDHTEGVQRPQTHQTPAATNYRVGIMIQASVKTICCPLCMTCVMGIYLLSHNAHVTAHGQAAAAGWAGALDGGNGHQGRAVQARQEHVRGHPELTISASSVSQLVQEIDRTRRHPDRVHHGRV